MQLASSLLYQETKNRKVIISYVHYIQNISRDMQRISCHLFSKRELDMKNLMVTTQSRYIVKNSNSSKFS